jgi:hypothetical protein
VKKEELSEIILGLKPGEKYIFHRKDMKKVKGIIFGKENDYRFVLEPEDDMRIERKLE